MKRFFWFLLIVPLFWISCTDEDMTFDIGGDKLDVKTQMGFIDTFTVRSYTVMLDSVRTSGLDNPSAVVGRYDDEAFGNISASSFMRLNIPSKISGTTTTRNYAIPNDAVFDSVRFYMVYDSYYEGDTLAPFTMHLHRLTQNLKPNDDGYFYNNDSIPCEENTMGSVTFLPSPHSRDTVWVRMDQAFGNELFTLMDKNDQKVTNNDYFQQYFKGLMIRYDESDQAILGFKFPAALSDSAFPAMRVYYHYFEYTTVYKYLDFKVQPFDVTTREGLQFNRFTLRNPRIEFPATLRDKLSSTLTNNVSYIKAGIGIVTRLEVPYIKNLFYIGDDIRIIDAALEIEPAQNTYTSNSLPRGMSLYFTDNKNRWVAPVYNKEGNESLTEIDVDMLYQKDTRYTFDVTNFMLSKLEEETDDTPAMLVTVSVEDLYKTSRRLIIGSQANKYNQVKLKVYYMNIE